MAASLKSMAADSSNAAVKKTDIYRVDPRLLVEEEGFNLRDYSDPEVIEHIEKFAQSYANGVPVPPLVVRNAWTMPQERYCTDWVKEKKLGIVLPSFKGVTAGVEALLADLPRYKAATRQLRNRAGDEVPDVLAQILQQSSWSRLQSQKAA